MSPASCEISKANARRFVQQSDPAALTAWHHCGCQGCAYCDEVELARKDRLTVDRSAQTTTDGRAVDEVRAEQRQTAEGQHASYIVLTAEERAKGFVRPVRRSYVHVGPPGPKYALREPTDAERSDGIVKIEDYPESARPLMSRGWTQQKLDKIGRGCGSTTTMGTAIAETYARDPNFYGSTFCVQCGTHLPVGADGEFVWDGTNERVGT